MEDRPNGSTKRWVRPFLAVVPEPVCWSAPFREKSDQLALKLVICPWVRNVQGSQNLFFHKRKTSHILERSYCEGFGFTFSSKEFVPVVIPTVSSITLVTAELFLLKLVRVAPNPHFCLSHLLFPELLLPQ